MFYLGGLTLGYLTPYPAVPDTAPALSLCQTKTADQPPVVSLFGDRDDRSRDDERLRPIVWPWHLFC